MKAITIHQPWASLIAIGAKRFETRSWATKYRGSLAIHAGQKVDEEAWMRTPEIYDALRRNGILSINDLPTGAVIAIANLSDCQQSLEAWTDGYVLENGVKIYTPETVFGDFTPGRYGWEMSHVKQIDPIPAKGQQGLWNWNHPLNP